MNSKVYAGGFVGALTLVGYIGYRIGSQEAMKTTKKHNSRRQLREHASAIAQGQQTHHKLRNLHNN